MAGRILLVALGLAAACKDGGSGSSPSAPAPSSSVAGSASGASEDPTVIAPATPSSNVTGAFLAACADDTESTYVKEDDQDVTACVVKNDADQVVPVESLSMTVVTKGGVRFVPEPLAKAVDSPWQVGGRLPIDVRTSLETVELTLKVAGQEPRTIATPSTAFDWRSDPAFAAVVNLVRELLVLFNPPRRVLADLNGGMAALDGPFHFIFVTEARHPASFGGLEAADRICADAAMALGTERVWHAVLSDSTTSFKDRVAISAPIVNYAGSIIAGPQTVFSGELPGGEPLLTELGYRIDGAIVGSDPPDLVKFTWSGTTDAGDKDPGGANCRDWTSADRGDRALAGAPFDSSGWAGARVVRCDRPLRLLCLSEPSSSPIVGWKE